MEEVGDDEDPPARAGAARNADEDADAAMVLLDGEEDDDAGEDDAGEDEDDSREEYDELLAKLRGRDDDEDAECGGGGGPTTMIKLELDSRWLFKLIYESPDRDELLDCMRTNATVATVKIVHDYEEIEFPSAADRVDFSRYLGRCLGSLKSLRDLGLTFGDGGDDDYNDLADVVGGIRQITSLDVCVPTSDTEPPESFDKALRGHPTLEVVDVTYIGHVIGHVIGHGDRRAYNPFPASLSTIPNLRSIRFSSFLFPRGAAKLVNLLPIRGPLSALREIAFHRLALDAQDNLALAGTISMNPLLSVLVAESCWTTVGNSEAVCRAIAWHPTLRCVDFSCPCEYFFDTRFYDELSFCNRLTKLSLRVTDDAEAIHASGLESLLSDGLMVHDSVEELRLVDYGWSDGDLCQCMVDYLASTTSLKFLCIVSRIFGASFGDDAWHQFCSVLSRNTSSLEELKITKPLLLTDKGLNRGFSALKSNKTLQVLTISELATDQLCAEVFLDCVTTLLGKDNGLEELVVTGPSNKKPVLSIEQGHDVLKALRRSYTLAHCPFEIRLSAGDLVADKDSILANANMICKLNRHGRGYLLSGSEVSLKEGCVAFLSNFSDDLDAVFFHLLENQSLCFRRV